MKVVKIFYDTETTGLNYKRNSIHELSGIIEVDGIVAEEFQIFMAPHPKAIVTEEALRICSKTLEEIQAYPSMQTGYRKFISIINKYIDRYNPQQKAYLIGFNNRAFDDAFIRMLFELNGDTFFGSYFWSDTQDTLILASKYLEDRRPEMPTFKLKRVAITLGLVFDANKLHGALMDATLTRLIYRIVTGIDYEI